ncbi:MAG: hypothetical protein U0802_09770 [Candidatus Binatia bacterium]
MSPLVAVALLMMTFSSCTCSSTTPEAPPTPAPRPGFGLLKPTQRTLPDVARGEVTPQELEARPAPTPPPAEAKLPESFPADVPLYEGAEVAGTGQVPNGNNVVFTADPNEDTPKVFSFYKDALTRKGWKGTQEYQGKDQSFLTFEKDNTVTNISISTDPKTGKRVIAVMYYEQKPLPFKEF